MKRRSDRIRLGKTKFSKRMPVDFALDDASFITTEISGLFNQQGTDRDHTEAKTRREEGVGDSFSSLIDELD